MTDVVFARTRHVYDSYWDYWRLVELSGFETCYIDEIDFQRDALYIISPINGEVRPHIDNHRAEGRKCTLSHWLLERPGGSGSMQQYTADNQDLIDRKYVDFNIVSDPQLAKDTGFKYVPMGSHAGLGTSGTEKHYDLIGLMAYSGRRSFLFQTPEQPHPVYHKMTVAPNAPAGTPERDSLLRSSRFGINVHQDPFQFAEPLRFALFAAYGLPIISEHIGRGHVYGRGMIECERDLFAPLCRGVLTQYAAWAKWGMWLQQKLTTTNSFRRCLEAHL